MSHRSLSAGTERLWFLNGEVTIAISKTDNAGGMSVLDHRVPMGDAPPLHIHHVEDEIFHIVSGRMRFEVGGRAFEAGDGETICAPMGVPHRYRVISPEGARYLTVTRGGFEAMVKSASRPAAHDGLPPWVDPSPDMQAELAALCNAERIEILGPPLS